MNDSVNLIIGICGGTGSGKTTVANRILETVNAKDVVFIQQDSYYRNLKDLPLDGRQLANFDHPDALDNDLLVNHIRKLKAGETVELPVYDFRAHTRLNETLRIEPKPIVIVEGILIFADPRLLEQLGYQVELQPRSELPSRMSCCGRSAETFSKERHLPMRVRRICSFPTITMGYSQALRTVWGEPSRRRAG